MYMYASMGIPSVTLDGTLIPCVPGLKLQPAPVPGQPIQLNQATVTAVLYDLPKGSVALSL